MSVSPVDTTSVVCTFQVAHEVYGSSKVLNLNKHCKCNANSVSFHWSFFIVFQLENYSLLFILRAAE